MKSRFLNYTGLAVGFFLRGLVVATAEEPARLPNPPIIFPEPKSETVSSNRNQSELKASPFKGLESDLKKPFTIFEPGRSIGSFNLPATLVAPPAAPANNQRMKELIDKREDMILLGPNRGDREANKDDGFRTTQEALDATAKKLESPRDRYYNRLERESTTVTNQARSTDVFGNTKDPDGKDKSDRPAAENAFDGYAKASARGLGRMSNNVVERDGGIADYLKPKTFDELMDFHPSEPYVQNLEVKESRLDEFKRLLGMTTSEPRDNSYSPNLPVVGAGLQPVVTSPLPAWSSPSLSSSRAAPADPRDSFTKRAGLVGAPPELQSLPSYSATAASLNPAPVAPPPPRQSPTSFSIPKRAF